MNGGAHDESTTSTPGANGASVDAGCAARAVHSRTRSGRRRHGGSTGGPLPPLERAVQRALREDDAGACDASKDERPKRVVGTLPEQQRCHEMTHCIRRKMRELALTRALARMYRAKAGRTRVDGHVQVVPDDDEDAVDETSDIVKRANRIVLPLLQVVSDVGATVEGLDGAELDMQTDVVIASEQLFGCLALHAECDSIVTELRAKARVLKRQQRYMARFADSMLKVVANISPDVAEQLRRHYSSQAVGHPSQIERNRTNRDRAQGLAVALQMQMEAVVERSRLAHVVQDVATFLSVYFPHPTPEDWLNQGGSHVKDASGNSEGDVPSARKRSLTYFVECLLNAFTYAEQLIATHGHGVGADGVPLVEDRAMYCNVRDVWPPYVELFRKIGAIQLHHSDPWLVRLVDLGSVY